MENHQAQSKERLIIASNRLPLSIKQTNGTYEAVPSSGGLVSALRGLDVTDYLWLGWPGMEVNEKDRGHVDAALSKENAAAVYLDEKLAQDHYNGFSSELSAYVEHCSLANITHPDSILWPILHYQSGVAMDTQAWEAYQRVNEAFADRICEEAASGDLIWVHDYHLFLLPGLLREKLGAQNKRCPIGFFLHTPFPVDDFWRELPVQEELLRGILGSDIIGFHTREYLKNFAGACEILL